MTISLMSLLGGNAVLSANGGKGEGDAPGVVTLTSDGDAAFEVVMAANELSEISAEKLRAFFKAHAAEFPAGLQVNKNQTASQVVEQIKAAMDGKKLPGELLMVLQQALPQDALQGIGQEVAALPEADAADWAGLLPERELTPEELSELVQETGLAPIVILAALQNTPAASPNLAYAMASGVGMEPAAQATQSDSLMSAQNAHGQDAPGGEQDMAQAVVDMMRKGLPRKDAEQLASQLAAVDFAAMNMDKQDVLGRIASVLRGETAQAEFDWVAPPAAANSNQPMQPQSAQVPHARQQAGQSGVGPVMQQATQPAGQQQAQVDAVAQGADDAAPVDMDVMHPAQMEKTAGQPVVAGKSQTTQPPAMQAGDAPAPQPAGFTVASETSQALRGVSPAAQDATLQRHAAPFSSPAVEQVQVHLRHALNDGARHIEIQLKPADLGRVDVRIDTDADGNSHVTVSADKRDTLDMLQRDARSLERALSDAGIKTDSNSLSFNLRGGDSHQQAKDGQQENARQQAAFDLNGGYADDLDAKLDNSEMALSYDAGRAYRLNLNWGVDISV